MASQKTCEKTKKIEEHIEDILKCPNCIKPIMSIPIHQCTNGHVVCKDCIAKLSNCPICRNDSTLVRNLMLEQIIEKLVVLKFISFSTSAWLVIMCQNSEGGRADHLAQKGVLVGLNSN